jgi:hypothetical protein
MMFQRGEEEYAVEFISLRASFSLFKMSHSIILSTSAVPPLSLSILPFFSANDLGTRESFFFNSLVFGGDVKAEDDKKIFAYIRRVRLTFTLLC